VSNDRFAHLRMKGLIGWPILALSIVVIVAFMPPRSHVETTLTAAAYAFYLTLFAAAVRACNRANVSLSEIFGPFPRESRAWIIAAGLAPLLLFFAAVAVVTTLSFAQTFAPAWTAEQVRDREKADFFIERLGAIQMTLLVLMVTVIAPIVEEIVFRGMLMRRWIAKRGFWTGLLGSAALFAVLHPPDWIGSFAFSVVAGILYLWSRSLLLPIFVHVLNNAAVTLVIALGSRERSTPDDDVLIGSDRMEWTVFLVFLLVLGSIIAAIVRPLLRQIRAEPVRSES
jgi:membrane protease YdiL (CAAX protease family)